MTIEYLLETSSSDGYLLEDGSGVLLLDSRLYRDVILAESPVLYLRLGEPSGTSAADESTNNNDGTYVGSPLLGQAGGITGDADTAVKLNGTSQFIRVPSIAAYDLGDGPLSIEFAIKFTSFPATESKIIDKSGTGGAYQLVTNGSGVFEFGKGGVGFICHTHNAIVDTTAFHHIVLTYAGGSAYAFYVDGLSQADADGTQTLVNVGAGNVVIGANRGEGSDFLPATLDEVAIYNVALTPTQVANHYSAFTGA